MDIDVAGEIEAPRRFGRDVGDDFDHSHDRQPPFAEEGAESGLGDERRSGPSLASRRSPVARGFSGVVKLQAFVRKRLQASRSKYPAVSVA